MNLTGTRSGRFSPSQLFRNVSVNPSVVFGFIILTALGAFEMFNYSTTDYALRDLLGNLKFAGIPWATILAVAFCGIDFAGIARLFTPEQGNEEPKEVWYLFGAWLLAATMNAILTWWGVSMAIASHNVQSAAVMDSKIITNIVPAFVAIMVWVIRILIIGTISVAGDRLVWGAQRRGVSRRAPASLPATSRTVSTPLGTSTPMPRPTFSRAVEAAASARPEPTYHSVSASSRAVPRPTENNSGASAPRRF